MVNINAAGDSVALVKAKDGVLSKTFNNVAINTVSSLYVGSSVMPKSVEFTLFGSALPTWAVNLKMPLVLPLVPSTIKTVLLCGTQARGQVLPTSRLTLCPQLQ
jgi:hypothetical protein